MLGALLNGSGWGSRRAQATYAFVYLAFALSAAPFLLFLLPIDSLFSSARPTAYTPDGRLVSPEPDGLSALYQAPGSNPHHAWPRLAAPRVTTALLRAPTYEPLVRALVRAPCDRDALARTSEVLSSEVL